MIALSRQYRMPTIVLFVATALIFQFTPAHARPSLASIDAKLDQLLAQGGSGAGFDLANHVVLTAGSSQTTSCQLSDAYFRVLPDGTREGDEFQVPAGMTLLITDVSWSAFESPTAFGTNRQMRFQIRTQNPDGSVLRDMYAHSGPVLTSSINDARLGGNDSISAGVPVGSGRILCPRVSNLSQSGFALNSIAESFLYGILIPNP